MRPIQKIKLPHDHVERLHFIKRLFPEAEGADLRSEWAGGRMQAIKKLNEVDAIAYAKNRNFLNGTVTHLSPYLRHGCITLNEVLVFVKRRFGNAAENMLMQLAWRDYWRQVWHVKGNAILSEMEPAKVKLDYQPLSDAVRQAKTGLPCMDGFIQTLTREGYLHNHARMWLASYIVHHLKTDWREAADWFESRLLDGDLASNHLSWQWVASTFSSKPYYFNKESLARYTGQRYCADCRAACPFDDNYEALSARLFKQATTEAGKLYAISPVPMHASSDSKAIAVFVHDEMLGASNLLMQKPFPKIFVFDPVLYEDWPLNRLQFMADCLSEMMSVEVWVGHTHEVLQHKGVGQLVTQDTPNLKIKALLKPYATRWEPVAKLVNVEISEQRLKRFSRYWEKVGPVLLGAV
ncbi:MAG: DNA photolyase [Betaproteobacteria bacterium HGW-Betaproteobacteria-22]|nr:MAG: DNA photolyase [Betaproteobacteria bacterium HGW-Betaproteobacteria-22]